MPQKQRYIPHSIALFFLLTGNGMLIQFMMARHMPTWIVLAACLPVFVLDILVIRSLLVNAKRLNASGAEAISRESFASTSSRAFKVYGTRRPGPLPLLLRELGWVGLIMGVGTFIIALGELGREVKVHQIVQQDVTMDIGFLLLFAAISVLVLITMSMIDVYGHYVSTGSVLTRRIITKRRNYQFGGHVDLSKIDFILKDMRGMLILVPQKDPSGFGATATALLFNQSDAELKAVTEFIQSKVATIPIKTVRKLPLAYQKVIRKMRSNNSGPID